MERFGIFYIYTVTYGPNWDLIYFRRGCRFNDSPEPARRVNPYAAAPRRELCLRYGPRPAPGTGLNWQNEGP
eukprot:scaffold624_cov402-Prasinococcus_capsulatus_cf.AAC.59